MTEPETGYLTADEELAAAEAAFSAAQQRLSSAQARVRAEGARSTVAQTPPAPEAAYRAQSAPQPGAAYQQTGAPYQSPYQVPYQSSNQGAYQARPNTGTYSNKPPYQPPYQQAASNQSSKPVKDHIAAGLLAILLGALGIHKFYLGYSSTGFIMMAITVVAGIFTIGLASLAMVVVGVIEGIIYLSKSQQEFEETYVRNKKSWF